MTFSFSNAASRPLQRSLQRRYPSTLSRSLLLRRGQTRTFLKLFKSSKPQPKAQPEPVLCQDNLFHPCSKSPFSQVRQRGEAIKKLAPCPVCAASVDQGHPHVTRKKVEFECPDCGWPTHCSEEHWEADHQHHRYCGRLRESNEDEHDLRSGRKMTEFDLPGGFLILQIFNTP